MNSDATTRLGFLTELSQDPYNEVTHQIFADWLFDQGEMGTEEFKFHRNWTPELQQKHDAEMYLRYIVKEFGFIDLELFVKELTDGLVSGNNADDFSEYMNSDAGFKLRVMAAMECYTGNKIGYQDYTACSC